MRGTMWLVGGGTLGFCGVGLVDLKGSVSIGRSRLGVCSSSCISRRTRCLGGRVVLCTKAEEGRYGAGVIRMGEDRDRVETGVVEEDRERVEPAVVKEEGEEDGSASNDVEDTEEKGLPLKVSATLGAALLLAAGTVAAMATGDLSIDKLSEFADWVTSLGAWGPFVYGSLYLILELIAVPALPLTVGCGFLFGAVRGTAIVSASSTMAAAVSFLISRYALREYVSRFARRSTKFQAVDRAVSKEGFKYTFLLRLSPIFPFALSNYLYGLTSLKFMPYILGSWLGMLPGTIAYVSGGAAAEGLTSAATGSDRPNLYLLLAGAAATVFTMYSLAKVASSALDEEVGNNNTNVAKEGE